MPLKCLNEKCDQEVTSYDCCCPKCGLDLYYKYHYNETVFHKQRDTDGRTER